LYNSQPPVRPRATAWTTCYEQFSVLAPSAHWLHVTSLKNSFGVEQQLLRRCATSSLAPRRTLDRVLPNNFSRFRLVQLLTNHSKLSVEVTLRIFIVKRRKLGPVRVMLNHSHATPAATSPRETHESALGINADVFGCLALRMHACRSK
jgi:hypothetical protein